MPRSWTITEQLDLEALEAPCQPHAATAPCAWCKRLEVVRDDIEVIDLIYKDHQPMDEVTKKLIAGYPDISVEDARLIFIRNGGRAAWSTRSSSLNEILNTPTPIKDATRDEAIRYISFLETYTKELRAYTQGMKMEYAKEIEPEINEHRKETEKKPSTTKTPLTDEEKTLAVLRKAGFNSKEEFLASFKSRESKKTP